MLRVKRLGALPSALLAIALVAGCSPRWEIGLTIDGDVRSPLTGQQWSTALESYPDECVEDSVPLERLLSMASVPAVESVSVDDQSWYWADVYDDAWVEKGGTLVIAGESIETKDISIVLPTLDASVTVELIDIAPTIAGALGVRSPEDTEGRAVAAFDAEHVVHIFLDGFGYENYQSVVGTRTTSFLDSLGAPRIARTVYPSATKASTAAMITGASPTVNGVSSGELRTTESETIFQVLTEAGLSSVAVEGSSLAFNLVSTEIIVSGDRDDDGYSDDNTYENALEVMNEGLPDFLWVHFHGIDDAGHTYGPLADETLAMMTRVDGYVSDIVQRLPEGTLVIICADHGMHDVVEDGRLGNHGSLLSQDMYIPFWTIQL